MAGRYFGIPFATAGDKVVVPDATQPDGSVSFTQGFGFDYERPNTDPSYKPVPRDGTNGLFHDITEALGIIQRQGVADWTVDAQPYDINAIVRHNDIVWRSLVINNNVTPIEGASWTQVGVAASETVSGLIEIATTAEATAGANDAAAMTPLKVNQTLSAAFNNARRQRFTANGSFTVPAGVSTIYVSAVAGGGGGGGSRATSSNNSGGGGGGGAGESIISAPFTVTPGQVIAITIGNGGAAGAVAGNGGTGGNTVIGSLATLTGGTGGGNAGAPGAISTGGIGGNGFPAGGDGADGTNNAGTGTGGNGASSPFGGGGAGGKSSTGGGFIGKAGGGFGAGGGGSGGATGSFTSSGNTGRTGQPGFVLIEY